MSLPPLPEAPALGACRADAWDCVLCPSLVPVHRLAEAFGQAVDAKDPHTFNHSQEVGELCQLLAQALDLSPARVAQTHLAGHLHDLGKIATPQSVLGKAGPLDPGEWELVRRHPATGARILRPCFAPGPWGAPDMVLGHHERWDGRGYPQGLAGRDIPLGARIIAVADSYSAMRQDRPYRPGMPHAAALAELERGAKTAHDPELVRAFLGLEARALDIMERLAHGAHPHEEA